MSKYPSSLAPGENLSCRLGGVSQSYPARLGPISHSGCLLAGAPFIDSLIFYVSLLHSPTGVFWDHPPNKLLALSPVSSAQSNISSGHGQSLASLSWTSMLAIPISLPCALPSGIYPVPHQNCFSQMCRRAFHLIWPLHSFQHVATLFSELFPSVAS